MDEYDEVVAYENGRLNGLKQAWQNAIMNKHDGMKILEILTRLYEEQMLRVVELDY